MADVVTQIPGRGGNIAPGPLSNNLPNGGGKNGGGGGGGLLGGLGLRKRALNVDADYVSGDSRLPLFFPFGQVG